MNLGPNVIDSVTRILGWTPQSWHPVAGGYTAAARYIARSDGRSAFVKVGATPLSARMLRREAENYRRLSGPYLPQFHGFDDGTGPPVLVIEDLSTAQWPPPWTQPAVDAVLARIGLLHATKTALEPFGAVHGMWTSGWQMVAEEPGPFLGLGLMSEAALKRMLPKLLEAERACVVEGDAVTHFDLRSDNMCIGAGGAKFVDWSEACLGNPRLDLGFWLPSLQFEGGLLPETILPDAPDIAAWVSGFFAARAGLPIIPDAPFVRRVQREQLSTALPWALRALGLAG